MIRRRRIVFGDPDTATAATPLLRISFASYMLKPTSKTFTERSAEWVRNDVPFGNWIIARPSTTR